MQPHHLQRSPSTNFSSCFLSPYSSGWLKARKNRVCRIRTEAKRYETATLTEEWGKKTTTERNLLHFIWYQENLWKVGMWFHFTESKVVEITELLCFLTHPCPFHLPHTLHPSLHQGLPGCRPPVRSCKIRKQPLLWLGIVPFTLKALSGEDTVQAFRVRNTYIPKKFSRQREVFSFNICHTGAIF